MASSANDESRKESPRNGEPDPVVIAEGVADNIEHHPVPQHLSYVRAICWIVTGSVSAALVAGVVITFLVSFLASDGMILPWIVALAIWAVVTGILALWSLTWPALEHRHTAWRVGEDQIELRHGVLWRSMTTVPRSRVQHTDVSQGPLERRLGLARLIIHTAGTEHATVTVEGLEPATAERIRDHLLAGRVDDAV